MDLLGPVYLMPAAMVSETVILCMGEDPDVWRQSLQDAGLPSEVTHQHRHAYVVPAKGVSFVLGGIGAGALEPMLVELTRKARRIVLIGTSGMLGKVPVGAHVIGSSLQAIGTLEEETPGFPNWPGIESSTVAISSDLFYAFDPAYLEQGPNQGWVEAAGRALQREGLVDMETHLFYRWMAQHAPHCQWVSIRAGANQLGEPDQMPEGAETAMAACLAEAMASIA